MLRRGSYREGSESSSDKNIKLGNTSSLLLGAKYHKSINEKGWEDRGVSADRLKGWRTEEVVFPACHGDREDKLNHNKIHMKGEADCQNNDVGLSLKDEWMTDITAQRRRNIGSGAQDRHD